MDGALQISNGSRDVTTPLSGMVCRPYAGTCYDWPVCQNLKSLSWSTTKIWMATKNAKKNLWFGHPRSPAT